MAAADPTAASADLDPRQRVAGHADRHPPARLRVRVPELERPQARRAPGLRPLLGVRRAAGARPQPVPVGVPAGGGGLRDRRQRREGVRAASGGALPRRARDRPRVGLRGAGLRGAGRDRAHDSQSRRSRHAREDARHHLQGDRGHAGGDRRQSGDGGRPDRGVRQGLSDREPAGDAAERVDAARADREEHLAVRRAGAAEAAPDLGRGGLGEPLVAARLWGRAVRSRERRPEGRRDGDRYRRRARRGRGGVRRSAAPPRQGGGRRSARSVLPPAARARVAAVARPAGRAPHRLCARASGHLARRPAGDPRGSHDLGAAARLRGGAAGARARASRGGRHVVRRDGRRRPRRELPARVQPPGPAVTDRAVARRRSDPARGDGHGPAGGAARPTCSSTPRARRRGR